MNIRLHVASSLAEHQIIELDKSQSHYLHSVMRLKASDHLNLFNSQCGEFICELQSISKSHSSVVVKEQIRSPALNEVQFTLAFAPIKNPNSSYIIQKGTELGVTNFVPVITERTIVRTLSSEKLALVATEAAEQCERLSVPKIAEAVKFHQFIQSLATYKNIFFCYEREPVTNSLLSTLINQKSELDNSLILIGPEGGFSNSEVSILKSIDTVKSVSIGNKILRADTAIISSLATFNAVINL